MEVGYNNFSLKYLQLIGKQKKALHIYQEELPGKLKHRVLYYEYEEYLMFFIDGFRYYLGHRIQAMFYSN